MTCEGKSDGMKLWINVRELRKNRGWTQMQAAIALGFCHSYITAVETESRGISLGMMVALVRVFDVKYEDFYHGQI